MRTLAQQPCTAALHTSSQQWPQHTQKRQLSGLLEASHPLGMLPYNSPGLSFLAAPTSLRPGPAAPTRNTVCKGSGGPHSLEPTHRRPRTAPLTASFSSFSTPVLLALESLEK